MTTSTAAPTPALTTLLPPSPNPANPGCTVRFGLARSGEVELAVFDVSGRKIRSLASGLKAPGDHTAVWDGTDQGGSPVPSGLYFYRLTTDEGDQVRKMTLLK